jgi:hypothetical protein
MSSILISGSLTINDLRVFDERVGICRSHIVATFRHLGAKKASLPLNGERLAIHRDRETFPTVGRPMTRVASQKLLRGLCLWFGSLHLLDSVL